MKTHTRLSFGSACWLRSAVKSGAGNMDGHRVGELAPGHVGVVAVVFVVHRPRYRIRGGVVVPVNG